MYESENTLPLGYTYERTMGDETWNSLSAAEKQEAMLQAAYLAGSSGGVTREELTFTGQSIPYTVIPEGNGVTQQDGRFVVTEPNATVMLLFPGLGECENYLVLTNIRGEKTPLYELYTGGDDTDPQGLYDREDWKALGLSARRSLLRSAIFREQSGSCDISVSTVDTVKTVPVRSSGYQFYNGRHDFIVNFGYSVQPLRAVSLTFPSRGVYTYDSLEVFCQPMSSFPAQAERLREDTLENVRIGADQVSGTISLDRAKVLCLSIPYSTGWRAWVDGTETPVERANAAYMALALEPGEHQIVLRYETPLMKLGALVSAAGAAALAVTAVFTERGRKKPRSGR